MDLQEIRQKKLQELQNQQSEEQKLADQLEQLEYIIKQRLDKEALVRYGNIRTADPERSRQLLLILAQIKRSPITDEDLKEILEKIMPKRREIKITRK